MRLYDRRHGRCSNHAYKDRVELTNGSGRGTPWSDLAPFVSQLGIDRREVEFLHITSGERPCASKSEAVAVAVVHGIPVAVSKMLCWPAINITRSNGPGDVIDGGLFELAAAAQDRRGTETASDFHQRRWSCTKSTQRCLADIPRD